MPKNSLPGTAEACVRFIGGEHNRPFFLVASPINLHDIYYLAIHGAARPAGKAPHGNLDSKVGERIADQIRQDSFAAMLNTIHKYATY